MKFIEDEHRDYAQNNLDEKAIQNNPIELFEKWFNLAKEKNILDFNAFILSTSSIENKPSSRVLLLKSFDDRGFVFFSNYESRKGKELSENPNASMLFFWAQLEKQIRIQGVVNKISPEESYEYFKTRPYTSRVGAWASKQSQPLTSRFRLLREVSIIMMKNPNEVPLPPFWGGYRLTPTEIEFWQGRPSRLHDRFQYKKINNENWSITRLYP
jgi:pyridoxamine 5'-phosphate oxidase